MTTTARPRRTDPTPSARSATGAGRPAAAHDTPSLTTVATPTPGGTLTTVLRGDTVLAAGFTDVAALAARLGLDAPPPPAEADGAVASAIARWIDGDLAALDAVRLDQPGTPFQQEVWAALRRVAPGETATYAELAAAVGRPAATRAVGSACGRNRIAPFIPCHRAVRSDGGLGGYAWGLDAKRWLLAHEGGQHPLR